MYIARLVLYANVTYLAIATQEGEIECWYSEPKQHNVGQMRTMHM